MYLRKPSSLRIKMVHSLSSWTWYCSVSISSHILGPWLKISYGILIAATVIGPI